MVQNESIRTPEEILSGLIDAERIIDKELETLAEEVYQAQQNLDNAIINIEPETTIYTLQDKLFDLKESLSDKVRERDRIIVEKDKVAMQQTDVQKFPPHQ